MTRHLLIPGRGVPHPQHWLQRHADAHPQCRWAPRPPGPPYLVDDRVADLQAAIAADDSPAVLIAHSAGCLTVAVWASRYTGPVRAALLVVPPWLDESSLPASDDPPGAAVVRVPRDRLPFHTVMVASRTDPYTTFEQFERYAAGWGAQVYDAGDAGHVDTASGYGPWPAGERMIAELS